LAAQSSYLKEIFKISFRWSKKYSTLTSWPKASGSSRSCCPTGKSAAGCRLYPNLRSKTRTTWHLQRVAVRLEVNSCNMTWFIVSFMHYVMMMQIAANLPWLRLQHKSNLLSTQQTIHCTVLNKNVGFNYSDKNLGLYCILRSLPGTLPKTFV
jgi:hypothetical protein